jgi:outer membrane protein TolC
MNSNFFHRLGGGAALAGALATMLAGCAAGPDYSRPALAVPQAYVAGAAVENGAQRYVVQQDIQEKWWRLFRSAELNELIEQAWAASPTIEAGEAALRAAQENVLAQQGFFFPSVQAGYSPSRTKLAGNLGGNSPGVQGN